MSNKLSKLNFRLEKMKRAKRGKRLIDMNLSKEATWMYWPVFKKIVWLVLIWVVGAVYFLYKYLPV